MLLTNNGYRAERGGGDHLSAFLDKAQMLAKQRQHYSNGHIGTSELAAHSRHASDYHLDQESDTASVYTSRSLRSVAGMERELKSSIAKLYQNYDFVTDEYDRLYEIVDRLREDYNNSKNLLFYSRYKEFRRLIKNSLRQWRSVEKRSTLAMSRKTSNTNYSLAMSLNGLGSSGGSNGGGTGGGIVGKPLTAAQVEGGTFSHNLDARLRAQSNVATRDLYAECTRLEREIFQYKSRNQTMKNLLCKLAESYDNSKAHVLHIWGRFKELRAMIKEVIDSDV